MAITDIGYAGTVSDVEWASLIPLAGGSEYAVPSPDDYRATVAAGTRNVDISPGVAAGQGVLSESGTTVTLNFASVGSGSRWDLVALHRNWGTTTTTLVVIQGGTAKALPARDNTPGVQDDQPLWLVRVAAGQTVVQEIVDIRAFVGNGGAYAVDDLVRSYIDRVGTVITVGTVRWERRIALGAAVWIRAGSGVGSYTPPQSTRITINTNENTVNLGSASYATILKFSVTLTEAALVDIRSTHRWYADANAAGTDQLRIGAIDGAVLDTWRSHNEGNGGIPVEVELAGRIALPAGTTSIFLVGQRESAGFDRIVVSTKLTAWATT